MDQVELAVYEIPVVYEEVKQIIPQLWEKHQPTLMVHVGVSAAADKLTLEQQAHNDGYDRDDIRGKVPQSRMCVDKSCHDLIVSGIDMFQVCEEVNAANPKVGAAVSHDPGRYICEFTYFLSLHKNKDCTAFIHVPPLDAPYTASEIAKGLQCTICAMLKQVLL